jgi:hypothetical protein
MCDHLGIPASPIQGEAEYVKKWEQYSSRVETYSYRLYSPFVGLSINIIPEDIGHTYIEDVLNPSNIRLFYEDKNLFDITFRKGSLPRTFLRRMHGSVLMDGDYKYVDLSQGIEYTIPANVSNLILKPSFVTGSGVGVQKFVRKGVDFVNLDTSEVLTQAYLFDYGDDFILQEALEQSQYLSQFNQTSINTLRLAVYRSVKDESVHVLASVMRIGKKGKIVDNGHAGGRFVGVDLKSGHLNDYVCDQYGNKFSKWNDVDFSVNGFTIPNWDRVLEFACYIGQNIHHCRLLALDIALDSQNRPCLIEYNISGFSFWLFYFSGQHPFGNFTDEILEYCLNKRKCK